MKSKISEYTEKEFLEFVKDIYTNNKKSSLPRSLIFKPCLNLKN